MRWIGLAVLLTLVACEKSSSGGGRRVVVLGFDGMDPKLLRRWMGEGKMPHFSKLAAEGGFKELATSMPPQSPVAWATFITGTNPGGHGIFDFIHRDPSNYGPTMSTSRTTNPEKTLTLGPYRIPLESGRVELLRRGIPFWDYLGQADIPATVIRCPCNYPTAPGSKARVLSGMGVPDLLGTYGTFSFFTDRPPPDSEKISGGVVIPVRVEDNAVACRLEGPTNTLRGGEQTFLPFQVYVDPRANAAKIQIGDATLLMNQGEWSDWTPVSFDLARTLISVDGMVRFYLKSVSPEFSLYVTPINMDPLDPEMPISSPEEMSRDLARAVGRFYTQGMPEDTKALSAGVLDNAAFVAQAGLVQDELMRAFRHELAQFKEGLFFYYFSSTDMVSHAFWRTMDPEHPAHRPGPDAAFSDVILKTYQAMDAALGLAMETLGPDTTLIVMSDHGFVPFYRAFNLGTWLLENGYLALVQPDLQEEGNLTDNVDWFKTRAYALGFNGLYVNQSGREQFGIVSTEEKDALMDELEVKLLALKDPATGASVISRVYRSQEIYHGPHRENAPDLLIGYAAGTRASWRTALGEFPIGLIKDNTDAWSGDHCVDSAAVPGILLANRPIQVDDPHLVDLAPTILAEFGIKKPEQMEGRNVLKGP